jgi:hypothetical protein
MLIANKVDVIVIDRAILDWHINQMDLSLVSGLKVDYIFPNNLHYYVAFKDSKLRNIFNTHLKSLKNSGSYQSIVNRYTHGAIGAQVQLTTLISALMSKGLDAKDDKYINFIGNKLVVLDYIDHIEITMLNTTNRTFDKSRNFLNFNMIMYFIS